MALRLGDLWMRWRRTLGWSGGIAAVLALGAFVYMKLIEGAWIRYNKWDRRERGALVVGDGSPDLQLPLLTKGEVHLSDLWLKKPVMLIFGSCT